MSITRAHSPCATDLELCCCPAVRQLRGPGQRAVADGGRLLEQHALHAVLQEPGVLLAEPPQQAGQRTAVQGGLDAIPELCTREPFSYVDFKHVLLHVS